MKKINTLLLLLIASFYGYTQNVGINNDGSTPESGTMLDIKSAGSTSATFGLKVKNSAGTDQVVVRDDGNVGVGLNNPAQRLHTIDTVRIGFISSETVGNDMSYHETGGFGVFTQKNDRWGIWNDWKVGSNTGIKQYARLAASPSNGYGGQFYLYDQDGSATNILLNSNGVSYFTGGNIGVGTIVAAEKLVVAGNTRVHNSLYFGTESNPKRLIYPVSVGDLRIDAHGGIIMDIDKNNNNTNGTFRISHDNDNATLFYVEESGNVGIGTTSPGAQLHTMGGVRFATLGSGTVVSDASGNLSVSSDERLKNIQGTFSRGISDIKGISPISYKWKNDTGYDTVSVYYGFSAQNVQENIPEAVGLDSKGYLTLNDRPIIATLINAVKEQQQIIEAQNKRVELLEAGMRNRDQTMDVLKVENEQLRLKAQDMNKRIESLENHLRTVNR